MKRVLRNLLEKLMVFLKKAKVFIDNNKRLSLSVFVLFIIIVGLIIVFFGFGDGFDVNIDVKEGIEISDVDDGYILEKDIVVSNDGGRDAVYDLVWVDVTNSFKTQSDLLYSISGLGDGSIEVGTSQVPVADSPIIKDIKLEKGQVHKYKLKIWYDKSSKSKDSDVSNFKGYVVAKKHK